MIFRGKTKDGSVYSRCLIHPRPAKEERRSQKPLPFSSFPLLHEFKPKRKRGEKKRKGGRKEEEGKGRDTKRDLFIVETAAASLSRYHNVVAAMKEGPFRRAKRAYERGTTIPSFVWRRQPRPEMQPELRSRKKSN